MGNDTDPVTLVERCGDDEFWFRICSDGAASIVRCATKAECLRIPTSLGGRDVAELAPDSCGGLACTREIVCPSCLRRIGERAFSRCVQLRRIALNEGLEFIGDEAFCSCALMDGVSIPSSVTRIGSSFAGMDCRLFGRKRIDVRIAPENASIFADEFGAIYERSGEGVVLVDGMRIDCASYSVQEGTVAIGKSAFARNAALTHVVVPKGVRVIGDSAFRGCTHLKLVDIPDTIETIGEGAFSGTSLSSVSVPQRCTDLREGSLRTGPVFPGSAGNPYVTTIREIGIRAGNPAFCLRGEVLCRRIGKGGADGRLEAVFAPRIVGDADLADVAAVRGDAFAGTDIVDCLRLSENTRFPDGDVALPNGRCRRVVVDLADAGEGCARIDIDLPDGAEGKAVVAAMVASGRVDVRGMLAAYDAALDAPTQDPRRLRMMAARLASPLHLDSVVARRFSDAVEAALQELCSFFGAKSDWRAFDHLLDAGILNAANLARIVGGLSAREGLAAGYLLDAKRRRFGKACWDYGI